MCIYIYMCAFPPGDNFPFYRWGAASNNTTWHTSTNRNQIVLLTKNGKFKQVCSSTNKCSCWCFGGVYWILFGSYGAFGVDRRRGAWGCPRGPSGGGRPNRNWSPRLPWVLGPTTGPGEGIGMGRGGINYINIYTFYKKINIYIYIYIYMARLN